MADPSIPSFTTPANTLVGRERELAVLRDTLAAALAGRGSLVLIGGEAGLGKSALAEAIGAEAATRGVLVLVGRCYDRSETPVLAVYSIQRRNLALSRSDCLGDMRME